VLVAGAVRTGQLPPRMSKVEFVEVWFQPAKREN